MKITGRRRIINTFDKAITIIQDFERGKTGFEHSAESEITLAYDSKIQEDLIKSLAFKYYNFEIDENYNKVIGIKEWKRGF